MPKPSPTLTQFTHGDDFDTEAKRTKLRNNILVLGYKFGSLTHEDITYTGLTVFGNLDLKGHYLSNISQALGVINLEEHEATTGTLHSAISFLGDAGGGMVLIPPHYDSFPTTTVNMRSNVQVVGSGPSSLVHAVSGGAAYTLFLASNIQKFAFRNFRIAGKRNFIAGGAGIKVNACEDCDGVIENVIVGPKDVNGITNAWHGTAIQIRGSSGVLVHGCRVNLNRYYGILIQNSASHVDVVECSVEENQEHGIAVFNSFDVRLIRNRVRDSGEHNVWIDNSSHVVIADNIIENASTSVPGTPSHDGVRVTGASLGVAVLNNVILDRPGVLRTTQFQVYLAGGTHLVYGNYLASVTNGLKTINDLSTESTRDGNHVHEGYYRVRGYDETGSFQTWWNSKLPARDFSATFSENLSQTGRRPPDSSVQRGPFTKPSETAWSDTGAAADARRIAFPLVVDLMGNPGSLLTPNNVHVSSTNAEDEIAAIQATYNIYQPRVNLFDRLVLVGGGVTLADHVDDWWGFWFESTNGKLTVPSDQFPAVGSANAAERIMDNSVLSAYFVGETTIRVHGYSSTSQLFELRPTWVRIHA